MANKVVLNIALMCIVSLGFSQKQSAEAYFNTASEQYVNNQKNEALRTLEEGLTHYGEDKRMAELAEKLLEEQQNEQEQKQNQQQEKQDKKDEDKENKDQNKQDQQNKEEKENQQQQNKDQQDKEEQQKQEQNKSEQNQKEQQADEQPITAAQKSQAMQDLKALENKEKALLKRINVKKEKGKPVKTEKDW